jgi:hypothetical protein
MTPLGGRQQELERLSALQADQKIGLINLLATGGMGMSRLALKLAEQHMPHVRDGVYFAPLKDMESEGYLASAIVESMELKLQSGAHPKHPLVQCVR